MQSVAIIKLYTNIETQSRSFNQRCILPSSQAGKSPNAALSPGVFPLFLQLLPKPNPVFPSYLFPFSDLAQIRHLSWLFSSPVPKGWESTWCTFSSTLMSSLSMALWFSFCVLILWRQQKWKSSNKKPFQKELASAWVLQTSCKYFSKNNLTRFPLWFLFLLSLFCTAESQNNCSFWLVLLKILIFI